MAATIAGRQFWLWRAVDDEGEVLDLLVQRRRDKAAAVKLMRKLLKKQGFAPDVLVTDKLRSYGAAKSEIGLAARHDQGLRANNRAENSHQPTRRRERKMQRFKSPGRNRTNVWNYPGANIFKRNGRKSDLDLHPTVKPIAMVADCLGTRPSHAAN
jgi:transposase-like protein